MVYASKPESISEVTKNILRTSCELNNIFMLNIIMSPLTFRNPLN